MIVRVYSVSVFAVLSAYAKEDCVIEAAVFVLKVTAGEYYEIWVSSGLVVKILVKLSVGYVSGGFLQPYTKKEKSVLVNS